MSCVFFDGGTCTNAKRFPEGTPTEIGDSACENCRYKFVDPKTIKIPVCWYEDEMTGRLVLDIQQMQDTFNYKIDRIIGKL